MEVDDPVRTRFPGNAVKPMEIDETVVPASPLGNGRERVPPEIIKNMYVPHSVSFWGPKRMLASLPKRSTERSLKKFFLMQGASGRNPENL